MCPHKITVRSLQGGLGGSGWSVPFSGCMSARSGAGGGGGGLLHAWDVITKFYEMKVGGKGRLLIESS